MPVETRPENEGRMGTDRPEGPVLKTSRGPKGEFTYFRDGMSVIVVDSPEQNLEPKKPGQENVHFEGGE